MCDNISAAYVTTNPRYHDHSKHIVVDYHLVRDQVVESDIIIHYVSIKFQLAASFTSGLSYSLLF